MTDQKKAQRQAARDAVHELEATGGLDALYAQIDAGQLQLTGEGGFVPGLIKAALERGLQAELTEHLGYEKGDPEARFYDNSRNGATTKTV
ncbi:IS256 family transposase, partial [Rathayibacter sp. YIM 133350]|uniref:transposase n=1 Tax=Rathayibacter sp. YIM 133350 TaxID=3131992 RepID=UPI003097E785